MAGRIHNMIPVLSMCLQTLSSLVQVKDHQLLGIKLFLKPMMTDCELDPSAQTSQNMKIFLDENEA